MKRIGKDGTVMPKGKWVKLEHVAPSLPVDPKTGLVRFDAVNTNMINGVTKGGIIPDINRNGRPPYVQNPRQGGKTRPLIDFNTHMYDNCRTGKLTFVHCLECDEDRAPLIAGNMDDCVAMANIHRAATHHDLWGTTESDENIATITMADYQESFSVRHVERTFASKNSGQVITQESVTYLCLVCGKQSANITIRVSVAPLSTDVQAHHQPYVCCVIMRDACEHTFYFLLNEINE